MTASKNLRLALSLWVILGGCGIDPATFVVEPLRLINLRPDNGAHCIDPGVKVYATFSDDLDEATLTDETFHLWDGAAIVPATITYDRATFTAKLEPLDEADPPLYFDHLYTIVVTQEVRGQNLGRLPVELTASFETLPRQGICFFDVECQLPSDCPGTQICANTGLCIDECVTDKDCPGICDQGTCVSP